jgi:hypothetical protein
MKDKRRMCEEDFLIVQGESIGYLRGAKPFDFVFIDEWESFTNTWLSRETHSTRMSLNWDAFISIWQAAKKVVIMDAFITKKTKKFLEAMGDDHRVLGSHHPPATRTLKYISITDNRRGGCVKNIDRIKDIISLAVRDLRAGKNIMVFYPYAEGSQATMSIVDFHKTIAGSARLADSDSLLFYGEQDDEVKSGLRNAKAAFRGKRLVVSNSCIIVGVSYTGADFDKMYMLRPTFLNIRDLIQFTYRIRKLRDNEVVIMDLMDKQHQVVFSGDSSVMSGSKHLEAFKVLEKYAEFERNSTSSDILRHYAGLAGYRVIDVDQGGRPIERSAEQAFEGITTESEIEFAASGHFDWDKVPDLEWSEVEYSRKCK